MTKKLDDEIRQAPFVGPARVMQVAMAFWESKVLLTAVDLGVFTALARGPMSAEDLQSALGLHARGTFDFLDALVSMGFLERESGLYSNSNDSSLYLDASSPSYLGGFLEMVDKRLYPYWGNLSKALRTGQRQNSKQARNNLENTMNASEITALNSPAEDDLFGELYANEERRKLFLQSMTGISRSLFQSISRDFPWERFKTFADIGAAQGGLTVEVAKVHGHLQGIGFDLPQVKSIFEAYVKEYNLEARLRFSEGDFFKDDLPSAQVLVMGHILHDWNLEEKLLLLAKAYAALPEGGALIVYDAMIDSARRHNTFGLLMSLNMLIETNGGFDYSVSDLESWLKEVGFSNVNFQKISPTHSMAVAFK